MVPMAGPLLAPEIIPQTNQSLEDCLINLKHMNILFPNFNTSGIEFAEAMFR